MSLDRRSLPSAAEAGEEMHALATELFPFCRSLTGDGVRETFDVIARTVPLERTAVPSGTQVYDWTLPREWNIRGARLIASDGRVVADFADSNLHVLNYSVPVSGTFSLEELRPHLFTDPDRPDVIPYRTSYHAENWGFCLPHSVYERLPAGDYRVEIDSTLEDGELVYAERFLPGYAGTRPSPYQSGYAAAKAGVLSFTESLAAALADTPVRAFAVTPGFTATAMTHELRSSEAGRRWLPQLASAEEVPPERIRALVLRLASGEADALHGRFVHALDDLDELLRRADEVERDDLYVMRLRR